MLTSTWFLVLACWIIGVPLILTLLGWFYARHAHGLDPLGSDAEIMAGELDQMQRSA